MDQPSVCVLGAAPDTSNLGVSALFESIVEGLHQATPGVGITVFDNGIGRREDRLPFRTGEVSFDRVGIRRSRRVYRPESLTHMKLASRLPLLSNFGVERLREAAIVVDISGGDSFTDLYGQKRFEVTSRPKSIVLDIGTPLVLLPQTYGPFADDDNRALAADLVRRAHRAWARDVDSFDSLRSLVGTSFDPGRHRLAVDIAFALEARQPPRLDQRTAAWFADDVPVLGLNVSGLLFNNPRSQGQFGFAEAYAPLMTELLRRLLDTTDARILLVPHVVPREDLPESDISAAKRLLSSLDAEMLERVHLLDDVATAGEVKWVISRCDAFCGTRMHSTIAALSTRTPVAALAYSDKTAGVFDSCGQRHRVGDLRSDGTTAIIDRVMSMWHERHPIARELDARMPNIISRARTPFDEIHELISANGSSIHG